jgi:hypothetical protein
MKMLTNSDFSRLRNDALARRRELVDSVEAARTELLEIDEFLRRLAGTRKHVLGSDEGEDDGVDPPKDDQKRVLGLPEMVSEILKSDARKRTGHNTGLKPSEITAEIQRRFDTDVSPRAVNSHVFYLFSRGRLVKAGTRYSWPVGEG